MMWQTSTGLASSVPSIWVSQARSQVGLECHTSQRKRALTQTALVQQPEFEKVKSQIII